MPSRSVGSVRGGEAAVDSVVMMMSTRPPFGGETECKLPWVGRPHDL
jgi:hypothetical protein